MNATTPTPPAPPSGPETPPPSADGIRRRRRRRSDPGSGPKTAFAPSSGASTPVAVPVRLALGLMAASLTLVHLWYGANAWLAAQWLTLGLALALGAALISPLRRGAADLGPVAPLIALFGTVIAIALWTLTPLAPGGAHEVWAWAELSPGSLTVDRGATTMEIIKLLGLACAFTVGLMQGRRRDWAAATLDAVIWVGAAYAAISLVLFALGGDIISGRRLAGGLGLANAAATLFGMLTVLGLGTVLRQLRVGAGLGWSARLPGLGVPLTCLALFVACLVLTASRAGVASTAIAAAALMVWLMLEGKTRHLPTLAVGLILAIGGGALLLAGGGELWGRIGEVGDNVSDRTTLFAVHWQAFLDSPLFGHGLGTFDAINTGRITLETAPELWSIRATHNVYLQWLEEAGLIGALPMFALVGTILVVSFRRSLTLGTGRTQHHALVASGLVVLIHGLVDFALQVPSVAAFWAFLLGLQFAFGRSRT